MKVGYKRSFQPFLHAHAASSRLVGVRVAWDTAAPGALQGRREQTRLLCSAPGLFSLCLPQALKWNLSPLTIVSWLNVYLQVAYLNDVYEVLLPQYPQQIFIQIAEASGHALMPLPRGAAGLQAPGSRGGGGTCLQLLFFP